MGETGGTSKNAISPMHQNLLPNNNDAQSTRKYGFLLRPGTQIVALRAHCTRTALKAPPKGVVLSPHRGGVGVDHPVGFIPPLIGGCHPFKGGGPAHLYVNQES